MNNLNRQTHLRSVEAGMPPEGRERAPRTLADMFNEFQSLLNERYETQSTRRVYMSRLQQLRFFIVEVMKENELEMPVEDFERVACAFMHHVQVDRESTVCTYNNYVSFLSLLAFIAGRPLHSVRRKSTTIVDDMHQAPPTPSLSSDDIESCLHAARQKKCKRTELLLSIMLSTGMSLARCLQLQIRDFINGNDDVAITVRARGIEKTYKVPKEIGESLLHEWLEQRKHMGAPADNPYVFPGKTGALSKTAAEWSIRSIGWSLGICVSPRSLRKTFKTAPSLNAAL